MVVREKIKFHQTLAGFFTQKPLYLDEPAVYHTRGVHSVAITPDSKFAVSGGGDPDETKIKLGGTPNLMVWDVTENKWSGSLGLSYASKIVPLPDSIKIIASAEQSIFLYDLSTISYVHSFTAKNPVIHAVSVTADGQRAVFGSGGSLYIWDIETNKCKTLQGDSLQGKKGIYALVLTPDGRQAVSSSGSNLLVWDIKTGRHIHTCPGKDYITAIVCTPDGKFFISAISGEMDYQPDFVIRVWDMESGDCIRMIKDGWGKAGYFEITPDGRSIIAGSTKGASMKIWEIKSGRCINSITGPGTSINSMLVTPDGQRIISSCKDKTMRIWDLTTGQLMNVTVSISEIESFAFHGNVIMTGDRAGNVNLYNYHKMSVPVLTGTYIYDYKAGHWDSFPTAVCIWCGKRLTLPESVLEIINSINSGIDILTESSTREFSQPEVGNNTKMLTDCPFCLHPLKFNPFLCDLRESNNYRSSQLNDLFSFPEFSEKESIPDSLHQKSGQPGSVMDKIKIEYSKIYNEAETAFKEENWEKAENLYLKLIQLGMYDPSELRFKMALCIINNLSSNDPERIRQVQFLIDSLKGKKENAKANDIYENLEKRLNLIKEKEQSDKKQDKPWWKKLF